MMCEMKDAMTEAHLAMYQRWYLEETRGLVFTFVFIEQVVLYTTSRLAWLKQVKFDRYIGFLKSLQPSLWNSGPQNTLALRDIKETFMDDQGAALRRAVKAAHGERTTDVPIGRIGAAKVVSHPVPATVPHLWIEISAREKAGGPWAVQALRP